MRLARTFLFAVLTCLTTLTTAWAQDTAEPSAQTEEAPAAEDASGQDAAAEETPAEQETQPGATSEQPATSEPGTSASSQQFEQLFAEWKDLLKQLREIKVNYQAASRQEREAMQQQWDTLLAQGHELVPRLTDAALAAYREAPNADLQLVRFLVSVAGDHLKNDRYEKALELGRELIDAKCELMQIYDISGYAAFALHDFDLAKQYWAQAQKSGVLTEESATLAAEVDEYKQLWEEEQKIREQEANSDLPRVRLTTNKGVIEIELFEDQAPETVGNFVSLVKSGFYDNVTFHRVLANFMAQAGDPSGDGSGGPGYEIYDELGDNARQHFRGSLSMANTGAPNSGGSQFFLTFRPTPHLNGKHTVFGRVISGFEVLEKLQRRNPEDANPPAADRIEKAEVLRQRDHEYVPNKVSE